MKKIDFVDNKIFFGIEKIGFVTEMIGLEDVRILVEIRRLSEFFSRCFRSVLPGLVALQQKYLAPGSFIGRARQVGRPTGPPEIVESCSIAAKT